MGNYENPCVTKNNPILVVSLFFSVSSQFLEVGMAVRPTAALLNHSCWPNTVRCSRGGAVVLMAARDIKPGEEVIKTLHLVCKL